MATSPDGRGVSPGGACTVGGVLSHGHLFGLKADVKSNVHFIEEHLVVYPCGHSVVLLHLETRAQQVSQVGVVSHITRKPFVVALSAYGMMAWYACIASDSTQRLKIVIPCKPDRSDVSLPGVRFVPTAVVSLTSRGSDDTFCKAACSISESTRISWIRQSTTAACIFTVQRTQNRATSVRSILVKV